uniref:Uncharacterized protein n=1 Tax=Pseudo-nitzschia australis TaxID=44445 RepID=A0A7S4AVK4_9STRA
MADEVCEELLLLFVECVPFWYQDENSKTKTTQIYAIGAKLHHVTKIRTLLDVVPTTTTTIVAPTRHRFSLLELRETMQKTDCIQITRVFLSFLMGATSSKDDEGYNAYK